MRFTPQQKLIAASAMSALTLGACLRIFWFVASGVTQDDAVRADIQTRLDGFAQDRLRAQAARVLRAERQGDITRILEFFVDRAHPVAFLQTLEELGRATDTAVTIEVDDAGSDREHLGFRVIVEGSEQRSMVRYVRLLERLPYVIAVSEINEERRSPEAQSGPADRLVASFRVRTQ